VVEEAIGNDCWDRIVGRSYLEEEEEEEEAEVNHLVLVVPVVSGVGVLLCCCAADRTGSMIIKEVRLMANVIAVLNFIVNVFKI
jgi:hypothetical protein